jgi:L-fuculose-phosphate aldolase
VAKDELMKQFDLREHKILTGRDLEDARRAGSKEILVRAGAVLTATARDVLRRSPLTLIREEGPAKAAEPSASSSTSSTHGESFAGAAQASLKVTKSIESLFHGVQAQALKEEIIKAGKKLWERQYVDGNGGNISCRLTDTLILCTPTLCSKADLTPEDICLVDLEDRQWAGARARTSEILMHLEIYKAVPQAKAVVHAHPPHATAYAITGLVPPLCIIPESELFVGSVALTPYETPGTKEFAATVVPYAATHNTILLANHGVVCWADTVTHAEWYMEVIDNYCRTLMLAAQLGAPITRIPNEKTADLLAIKKRLGLPDPRFEQQECQLCDQPDYPVGRSAYPAACPTDCQAGKQGCCSCPPQDMEPLIQSITQEIMKVLNLPNS